MRNVKWLWAIIAVQFIGICFVFFLFVSRIAVPHDPGMPRPSHTDPIVADAGEDQEILVATIGNVQITHDQLHNVAIAKYGKEVLHELLDQIAIQMEANSLNIKVVEEDIDYEINKLKIGYDDEDAFYKAMEEIGMDRDQLREDTYYNLLMEHIATKDITVSDELVKNYMEMYPEEFRSFTQIRLHQIKTDTEGQAEKLILELSKGASFEQIAKERSLDDATRSEGGDLGWVEEHDPFLDQRLLRAGLHMKTGEVSSPIRVDDGYVIIKVSERKEIQRESGSRAKEDVRRQLALREARPIKALLKELWGKYEVNILNEFYR